MRWSLGTLVVGLALAVGRTLIAGHTRDTRCPGWSSALIVAHGLVVGNTLV
jgi:hypothetical protein